jgi:hypothetical protein
MLERQGMKTFSPERKTGWFPNPDIKALISHRISIIGILAST